MDMLEPSVLRTSLLISIARSHSRIFNKSRLRTAIVIILILVLSISGPNVPVARADFVDTVLGIPTDPLKLGKFSDALVELIERIGPILDQLDQLSDKINNDLKQRIADFKAVVDEAISAIDRDVTQIELIINGLEQKAAALELAIYNDAKDLLYRVQCTAEVFTSDQLQRGLAQAIGNLKRAHPGIKLLGITIVNLDLDDIHIDDPDIAYQSLRDGYLQSLKELKADAQADDIVSSYSNIARMARFAKCSYLDQPRAAEFVRDEATYNRLAGLWISLNPTFDADRGQQAR
jgi:hypothetical protein